MKYLISIKDPWLEPPECLTLTGDEVHVWRARLDQGTSLVNSLFHDLSADERKRQGKFHFQKDRDRFVIARGVLRNILSRYLGIAPCEIGFLYGRYGKPRLRDGGEPQISFNVSHAHELALYVISKGRRLGIDIEYLRDNIAVLEIAEQFFSPLEISALNSLPLHLQTVAFFNCWTRKEAYIKALGEGLSHRLDGFAVSLKPGELVSLLKASASDEVSHWSLMEIPVDTAYVASLATEGTPPVLHQWQWNPQILRPIRQVSL
jgi:4'-phosphopantetheinyl transferase